MAMMLEYSNHITLHNASVQRGEWSSCPDFSYTVSPIFEWYGKTMGIVGMGTIGSRVGNMAASMGMHVIYHHRRDLNLSDRYLVSLEKLAESSDVISLHCPLNASTEKMINAEFLASMKKTAILINTSRGGLIDTAALRKALEEKQIAAALLDVLEKEPPPADHPLIGLPNAIITPHIAWISFEARQRIFEIIKTTISSFETGQLINRVN
jgi:glycerate dehydrogenase